MMYHFVDNLVKWSSYFDCKLYNFKKKVWEEKEISFSGSRNVRFELPVHYKGVFDFILDCSSYIIGDNTYFRSYIM